MMVCHASENLGELHALLGLPKGRYFKTGRFRPVK
jgi:hypothetical protein